MTESSHTPHPPNGNPPAPGSLPQGSAAQGPKPFAHLHLHTQYSILDGAIRIKELPGALAKAGYQACAITDHGNLFGAVEFHHALKKKGIQPILGMEAYVAVDHRANRRYDRPGPNAHHLVLLCKTQQGYKNLMKLASRAALEGKYYVPRMDRELLEEYQEGLIALSACMGGMVARPFMEGQEAKALEAARWGAKTFPGRFYLEIQDHGQPDDQRLNPFLLHTAQTEGIPLVGTNDCHYLRPEEAYPHYILQLMGWQKKVTDPGVDPFVDKNLYLKTPEEMAHTLAPYPAEAYDNTWAIAQSCDVSLDNKKFYLPRFDIPQGYDEESWFRKAAAEGLERRLDTLEPLYGISPDKREEFRGPYHRRLDYELNTILQMKYPGYFLIVAEFINWAKENQGNLNPPVRVGPGRGSGAGSLVAYALRITDLDPLKHGLLFERFLNPERVSLPDFDIDFDVLGRDAVIDHVKQKYGENRVCQISTFGSLGAKAALRGVARVMDFPYAEADKIAKLIPNRLGITLDEAIALEPELARLERDGSDREKKLIAYGKALEGLNDKMSTHAAGVIIMDTDIVDVLPLCQTANGEGFQSQYGMKWAEDQGAVKFDFLGLLNLTIIEAALALVNKGRADPVNVDTLPLDDPKTFELLGRGDTTGVFQLESGGMRRLLAQMKPSCFEDLVAILALYRPGPLGSGMVDDFVKCKNGQKPIAYPHPLLAGVLKETYGVMVYQEQVMEAVRVLAGFSLGQADLLRRAIGKKIPEELARQREKFVEGCAVNDISAAKANEIFDLIDYFSGYGFNKSHSAAYGLVAYQTAWLKAHYPVEFMAALLSSDMNDTDKVVNFIAECREMGVEVLPPDVNQSGQDFTIHGRAVRFGLNAVKNVGANAAEVILAARAAQPGGRFPDLTTFVKSVDLYRVNKRVMEALIKCGAFDSLYANRAELLANLENIMAGGMAYHRHRVEGQGDLLGLLAPEEAAKADLRLDLTPTPAFRPKARLKLEKEALGFYISGHPMDGYASELSRVTLTTVAVREGDLPDGAEVLVAGVVAQPPTVRLNKSSEKFAIVRLEDQRGSIEVPVFSRLYAEAAPLLVADQPLLIKGRVNRRDEEVSVQANEVRSLSLFRQQEARKMVIPLERLGTEGNSGSESEERLRRLLGFLSQWPGSCEVFFDVAAANGARVLVRSGAAVSPTEALVEELETLLGGTTPRFTYSAEAVSAKRNGGKERKTA
ncbi:MAG: DNA polymerase III subunit alpha [Deltaproteobacteria bacterium]|nr:DNA polymerase III subunit alpha [Deltaproteobacteria bacterium]